MVQDFAEALMGAEVDALRGASYGERSDATGTARPWLPAVHEAERLERVRMGIGRGRESDWFP